MTTSAKTVEGAADDAAPAIGQLITHLKGCPSERLEQFEAVRPSDRMVLVMDRCIDCGAQASEETGRIAPVKREGVIQ